MPTKKYKKNKTLKKVNKLCVIYTYYEKDETYKENFNFFLKYGLYSEVDYYIIINGTCSIKLPTLKNVFIHHRDNIGYDFGAYSYMVHKLTKKYDYYFFINTSVKGPFLKNKKKWYEPFIELFKPNVHVVGTSINICTIKDICIYDGYKKKVNPHVQSMFFCIDHKYFNELKHLHFFDEEKINKMSFTEVIQQQEIKLSEIAIKKGYNINSILSKYKDLDYTQITKNINPTSKNGDPYYKHAYFGESIDPYEVIFFKTNRGI